MTPRFRVTLAVPYALRSAYGANVAQIVEAEDAERAVAEARVRMGAGSDWRWAKVAGISIQCAGERADGTPCQRFTNGAHGPFCKAHRKNL